MFTGEAMMPTKARPVACTTNGEFQVRSRSSGPAKRLMVRFP
jgi:hypothetical protein